MRLHHIWIWVLSCGVIVGLGSACKDRAEVREVSGKGKGKGKGGAAAAAVASPPGYDLGAPVKYAFGEALREISGICFLRGKADTMYAIEDEDGKLFSFHLGGGIHVRKFGGHGDYEDVTVLDDKEFAVLRSDGSLFVFPVGAVGGGKEGSGGKKSVRAYVHILPAGEYEGLFGDEGGRLIALCKNCSVDDQSKEVTAYTLGYDGGHSLVVRDHFQIEVPADSLTSTHKHVKFHPSALARHPLTGEWYVISSVNKVLIVFDEKWKVRGMYSLDPILFKQPEGLAFNAQGDMYISNEGGQGRANVLLFRYKK